MAFELPQLPYAYNALEPHIDARTMEIHHTKHHNAYTTNLNAAIAGTDLEGKTIENILINLDKKNAAVRNNGGGFYNHIYFGKSCRQMVAGYLMEIWVMPLKRILGLLRNLRQSLQKPAQHSSVQDGHGFAFIKAASWKCARHQTRTIR